MSAPDFTSRQIEIMALVGSGKSYEEVAAILIISRDTVRHHVDRARSLCRARNVTHLITFMIAHGVLEPDKLGRCAPVEERADLTAVA